MFVLLVIFLIVGLVAIPIYFIARAIFKKFIVNNRTRRLCSIISTIVMTPIACAIIGTIFGVVFFFFFDRNTSNYFYEYRWHDNPSERHYMSRNLIQRKKELLIGKTKVEVIEMLGEDFFRIDENTIYYKLKKTIPLFISEKDVLKIYFWNGRVVNVMQPGLIINENDYYDATELVAVEEVEQDSDEVIEIEVCEE